MAHILVVDDEPGIRQLLGYVLASKNYSFDKAANTQEAEHRMKERMPDLILLDWMLPGIGGMDWLRRLRWVPVDRVPPVIFLTARTTEADKVLGLEAGGDDYITKPFSNRELLARIESVLRRYNITDASAKEPMSSTFGRIKLDRSTHQVTIDGATLKFNRKEFQLLWFFATHPERVYDRQKILDHVWGASCYVGDRTVDVHVRRLRCRLAEYGLDHIIRTVWGVGYLASTKKQSKQ